MGFEPARRKRVIRDLAGADSRFGDPDKVNQSCRI
jgi:hypothetical protein